MLFNNLVDDAASESHRHAHQLSQVVAIEDQDKLPPQKGSMQHRQGPATSALLQSPSIPNTASASRQNSPTQVQINHQ